MFHQTRLKLTAWYLLIIMMVSFLFSVFIFASINRELNHIEDMQQARQKLFEQKLGYSFVPPPNFYYNPDIIDEARKRVILTLGFINLGILIVSGTAGYFLAGRTLKPIKISIDEQNRFVQDASHELRTPLTVLRSEIEVALRSKKLTPTDTKIILKSNLEEVVKLQLLTDELLDIAHLEHSNKDDDFVILSLKELIRQSIRKLDSYAKKKKISIVFSGKNLKVLGDSKNLTTLFTILLDNAIKYSHTHSKISVSLIKKGNYAIMTIADHGIGIDEKDLPHIFDRFYRANTSRSKEIKGYGLGLSIAKKIVIQHNGSITALSNSSKGTIFTVELPLA